MLWVDEGADLDDENADKIKKMVITPIKATVGVQWAMFGVGCAMVIVGIGAAVIKGLF